MAVRDDEYYREKVYRNDPIVLLDLVGKCVEVKTSLGRVIKGTVVTIDPVTESVVLIRNEPNIGLNMDIVMGHNIIRTSVIEETPLDLKKDCELVFEADITSNNQLQDKFARMKRWLNSNLIPVDEDGPILRVGDSLTIHPPYRPQDVFSSNEMVLHRVLKIIESIPQDF